MDNKRFITGMLIVSALFLVWMQVFKYLDQKHPEWHMRGSAEATTQPAEGAGSASSTTQQTQGAALGSSSTNPTMSAGPASTQPAGLQAVGAAQPMPANLGLGEPGGKYAMALSISARGAGLEYVTLNDYKQHVDKPDRYRFQQPYDIAPDTSRALATRSVSVDGVEYPITEVAWTRQSESESTAIYTLDLVSPSDNKPVLRLRKTFELKPRADRSSGHETLVNLGFENLAGRPLKVRTSFNGPTLPPREVDRGPDRQAVSGYFDETHGTVTVSHHFVEEFVKEKQSQNLIKSDKSLPMLWTGTGSVYFNAFVRPDPIAGAKGLVPNYLAAVQTQTINPDALPEDHVLSMVFNTEELTVDPNTTLTLPLRLYFGPRDRHVLDNAYYSALPFNYDATLVITSGLCAFCTFDWLIQALVAMLQFFHWVCGGFMGHGDWGLAIICLVGVVRLVLHPVTKKSQVSMMKMGKMGPEMERLKKKYGDNKDELNKAMMQFYKEQGVTPILGCLPMFLQMPIWIALWQALQTEFALRHAPFLWGLTWIHDLAKPDALIAFKNPVPLYLFGWTLHSINILPVLMAIVTIINQKYMPQPAASTPEAEQQQKMMKWMSVLFPLMFYTMPSGLNLYYVTSMGLGIIESKRIREHIKQREEAEKAGKVIVDAKPTRQSKKKSSDDSDAPRKAGLMGWLADLQARAEQLRNTERKGK